MNAFDKVIGYKATKRELLQLCDMLRNREIYEEMGARLPHGLLLYGAPGLGKTLLARCYVEESGLHTITVRCDKGGDAFIDGITRAFASAKTKAPSMPKEECSQQQSASQSCRRSRKSETGSSL